MAALATMLTRLVLLQVVSLVIVNGQDSTAVIDVSTQSSGASTLSSTPSSSLASTSTLQSSSSSSTTSTSTTTTATSTTTSIPTTSSTTVTTTSSAASSSPIVPSSTNPSSTDNSTAATSSSSSVAPSSSSSSSSSQAAFSSTRASTSKAASTPAAHLEVKLTFDKDPNDARVAAAVAGGCGLFLLNTVFFIVVSILLRNSGRMERRKMPKIGGRSVTGGAVNFYGGPEVQSAQALFAPSLSATNIVSGASDIQLDARGGRSVYVNRGFEPGLGSQSALAGDNGLQSPGYDSSYKPIEIKSSGASSSRA